MNSSPENLPQNSNSQSTRPDLEPIDNLLNLLLDEKSSANGLPQDEAAQTDVDNEQPSHNPLEAFDSTFEEQKSEQINLDADYPSSRYTEDRDLETDAENKIEKLTLEKAVEYQVFLKQTLPQQSTSMEASFDEAIEPVAKDSSELQTLPDSAKKLDVVDSVNTLIPLMVELLKYKIDDSQETIIKAVSPVLDLIIEQRSLEDSPKMAAAIAKILPHAIAKGINLTPEEIAKAIAPELALCIKEQIRLDQDAISEALGSEMGKAIKTQIELEKDAMVDALYPVIGSTISKYMVEVVQDINRKVENTLSPEGIKRKVKAKIQGVSEAELIFRESIGYYVQAVFLIAKDSGIVIEEIKREADRHLDSDLIAGMLTAIRSFANDCIISGSELDAIDYGDWQIPIEVAGYCYLAVVVKGEPSKEFRVRIRRVLGEIVLKHGKAIANYQKDMTTNPVQIRTALGKLIYEQDPQPLKLKSSPLALLWLIAFILGLVLIPWGIISYRGNVAHNIEQITAAKLDAAPELSIYRLEPYVNHRTLTISGRVPSEYLKDRAGAITQKIASQNNLQFDNQIIAIQIAPSPDLVNGEVQRLSRLFNQQPNNLIKTNYEFPTKTLIIKGFVTSLSKQEFMVKIFDRVPGIAKIILNVNTQLPTVKQRIYFNSGSNRLVFADTSAKLDSVVQFLEQYPQLHLKLIAHNDGKGTDEINQRLNQERCQNVQAALVAKEVDSTKLVARCPELGVAQDTNNQATWLDRYVSFEPFIPTSNINKN